jgi:hypothetical protein
VLEGILPATQIMQGSPWLVPVEPLTSEAVRIAAILTSTIAVVHIRALTALHQIEPTSPRCPSAWQPNPGRRSTYRRGKSVQTTGTTSVHPAPTSCLCCGGNTLRKIGEDVTETLERVPSCWKVTSTVVRARCLTRRS